MTNKINGIDVSECEYINCCSKKAKCIILQDDILSDSQYCESEPECYFKQLKRLQKENEELKKKQITKNGFICDCEQNAKYRQALEEIREITNEYITYCMGSKCEGMEEIQNKINEVFSNE